jgi:hypothetical protein
VEALFQGLQSGAEHLVTASARPAVEATP